MAQSQLKAIGIDLGTVNSCVGVLENGSVEIIPYMGRRITPSVVSYDGNRILIGDAAKNRDPTNPENRIYNAKRFIGQPFSEIPEHAIERLPFNVVNHEGKPHFEVFFEEKLQRITPQEISAAVLSHLKKTAENYFGEPVINAVVTIPAHFNDAQRQATKDAAEIAGLNVLRLLNEPSAAAIAYGLKAKKSGEQNILVYDLGGGTFDVSILTTEGDTYEVKAVGGDMNLGGEDFNNKMLDHFVEEIKQLHGVDISSEKKLISLLLKECEIAKRTLSNTVLAKIHLEIPSEKITFESKMTRACFEGLNAEYFEKTIEIVMATLREARFENSDIDEIILVGGSTYIPKVQQILQECFRGKELNKRISPDEAVAYGASVLASQLNGDDQENTDLLLLDVIPRSLGIELKGGKMNRIVEKNTTFPIKVRKENYSTARPNQTKVSISVYEGEDEFVRKNKLLGKFPLDELPTMSDNVERPNINVIFEIDSNGILTVHGEETISGVKNKIENIKIFSKSEEDKTPGESSKVDSAFYQSGLDKQELGDRDGAFESFTQAIENNERVFESMARRASIHFHREEYEDSVIECEEIPIEKRTKETEMYLENAKTKIPSSREWFKVLKVGPNASDVEVRSAYRKLANLYSPHSKKNFKKSKVDKKKLENKLMKLNEAKTNHLKSCDSNEGNSLYSKMASQRW